MAESASAGGDAAPTTRHFAPPKVPVEVRLSGLRDIRPLVEMYMALSPEARAFYHPFPFDRSRLWVIFGYMVLAGRLARATVRMFPHWSVILIVATRPDRRTLVGYGTVRFVGDRGTDLRAKMGFTVGEGLRGLGIGTQLLKRMIAASLAVGVTRAVGTILRSNTASLNVARKFGGTFQERPEAPDLHAPGQANLHAEGDLAEFVYLLEERDRERAARRLARERARTH